MLLNQLSSQTSPLTQQQVDNLSQAVSDMSATQLAWISGYLSAVSTQGQAQSMPSAVASQSLTILYASQTGNAKGVAEQLKKQAEQASVAVNLQNMADYKPKSLKQETHLVIVASTHGEGEPPDDAIEFYEFLHSKKAPKLDKLSFAVVALGDSSYEFFCKTGADFDVRLEALGAKRNFERLDCDVDYQQQTNSWIEKAIGFYQQELEQSAAPAQVISLNQATSSAFDKTNPYSAELVTQLKITGRDSVKDIRHVEFSLEESGIQYKPGDALGVWFENDPVLVDEILALLSVDPDAQISIDDKSLSIRDALISEYELTQCYKGFIEAYANFAHLDELKALVEDKEQLRAFLGENQIIDVIKFKPVELTVEQLQSALRRITPRLYSIASSQQDVEDEVHLTVGLVEDDKGDEVRLGGASNFLGQRLAEGAKAKIFIEANNNFRLPEDHNKPIIMIGPGTGVAPFRAFMQERDALEASGESWLFFGNPNFTQDFLYQTEWQDYVKRGVLTRIDMAFSRDQKEKIYVQHKLLEQAAEVWQWLEKGAHVYVCGDQHRMAKDVHQALIQIISEQGQMSEEQATEYLSQLRKDKRYQKDVY